MYSLMHTKIAIYVHLYSCSEPLNNVIYISQSFCFAWEVNSPDCHNEELRSESTYPGICRMSIRCRSLGGQIHCSRTHPAQRFNCIEKLHLVDKESQEIVIVSCRSHSCLGLSPVFSSFGVTLFLLIFGLRKARARRRPGISSDYLSESGIQR